MRIGAGRLELYLAESDSIKGRRRVARAIADRLRQRFGVSVADVGDQDDRHRIELGVALVGVDPRHVRERLERIARHVEDLGLAELVGDDLIVACLDELEPELEAGLDPADAVPAGWLAAEEGGG